MMNSGFGLNKEDHTKNFSFTINKSGVWFLSPAYNIGFSKDRNDPLRAASEISCMIIAQQVGEVQGATAAGIVKNDYVPRAGIHRQDKLFLR